MAGLSDITGSEDALTDQQQRERIAGREPHVSNQRDGFTAHQEVDHREYGDGASTGQ